MIDYKGKSMVQNAPVFELKGLVMPVAYWLSGLGLIGYVGKLFGYPVYQIMWEGLKRCFLQIFWVLLS